MSRPTTPPLHQTTPLSPPSIPSFPFLRPPTSLPPELRNLLAGGLSGMLAKSVVAPLDRIKILYQVTSVPFYVRHMPKVIRGIVQADGVGALWRGNTATMVRIFPYAGIQFMVFDECKVYFAGKRSRERMEEGGAGMVGDEDDVGMDRRKEEKWGMRPMESLVAGSLAGAVSVLCTYPLDLARAQLAVSKKKVGKIKDGGRIADGGFIHILKGNYMKEGIKGLFRGITPTLLGILPYAGLAFTINEQAKRQIYNITKRDPTTLEKIQCGALSGLFAQSITYPLEVTRRRMQTTDMLTSTGSDTVIGRLMMDVGTTGTTSTPTTTSPEAIRSKVSKELLTPLNNNTTTTTTTTHTKPSSSPHPKLNNSPSMLRIIRDLAQEQGVRGFYKGLSMNWLKGPTSFAISFTTFDLIQGWMESEDELQRSGSGRRRNLL